MRSVPGFVWICCCLLFNNTCPWNTIPHRADVKKWRWRRAFSWWRTSHRKAVTSLGDGDCDAIEDSKVNILSDAMGRELMTLNSADVSELYCSVLSCTAVSALYCSAWVVQHYSNCSLPDSCYSMYTVLQCLSCTTVLALYCNICTLLPCLSTATKHVLYCSTTVVLYY